MGLHVRLTYPSATGLTTAAADLRQALSFSSGARRAIASPRLEKLQAFPFRWVFLARKPSETV